MVEQTDAFRSWGELVGRWFHTFNDKGEVSKQGMILSLVKETTTDSYYLVQHYEWMAGSESSTKLARLSDMLNWEFYESAEVMRDTYEHELQSRKSKD